MLTRCLHLTKYTPFAALILLLVAVSYFTAKEQSDVELHQAFMAEPEFRLDVAPWPVEVEEEITLVFSLNQTVELQIKSISARVEGLNMNMGIIPVVWSKSQIPGQYTGIFMLGSCSEPVMRWQLILDVRLTSGKKIQRIAEFSSTN